MAIYHCSVSVLARADGKSAVAAAAYRAGERLEDHRLGQAFDYRAKGGITFCEILLPKGAPERFQKREILWNEAEGSEVRRNARTARECRIALPHELTSDERIELAREFADALSERYRVAVDMAVHAPDDGGDDRNWHAHLLFTTREIDESGFGAKTRRLDDRRQGEIEIRHIRALWREHANRALDRAGLEVRLDERSYEERGLDITPTVHLGPFVEGLERQGTETRLGDLNREAAADWANRIVEQITRTRAVFDDRDIAIALDRQGLDPGLRHQVLTEADGVLPLFDRETGAALGRYTLASIRAQETRILERAEAMAGRAGQGLSARRVRHTVENAGLDPEQEAALAHAASAGGIALIEGRAGTGKTYTLNAIRTAYQKEGYRVIGLAPTNSVASDLTVAGFGEARTVHSLLWHADQARETGIPRPEAAVDRRSVLIVDEAAMLDSGILDRLTGLAQAAGAKLILVGDDRQLASVERGGMFGTLCERLGAAELTTVRRQRQGWQREASEAFARGDFEAGIKAYADHGFVHWSRSETEAKDALVAQWTKDTQASRGRRFVFAYTNREVDELNRALQEVEIGRGRVDKVTAVRTDRGEILLGEGDRIQMRGTDKPRGLVNGALGTVTGIEALSGGHHRIAVAFDDGREVTFDTAAFDRIALGYAGTIYKGQGRTLDETYLMHSRQWRDQASYVAMTRARDTTHVFVARDNAAGLGDLARQMGRLSGFGASLAYATEGENEIRRTGTAGGRNQEKPPTQKETTMTDQTDPETQRREAAAQEEQARIEALVKEAEALKEQFAKEAAEREERLRAELARIAEEQSRAIAADEARRREQALKDELARQETFGPETGRAVDRQLDELRGLSQNPARDPAAILAALRAAAERETQAETEKVAGTLREKEREKSAVPSGADLPGAASSRYNQALGACYDPRMPTFSLAKAALMETRLFGEDQRRLMQAQDRETDPARRDMLALRREIEFFDHHAQARSRIAEIGSYNVGRETDSTRANREQAAEFVARANQARETWIDRAVDRPDLYPPMHRAMEEEIARRRAERQRDGEGRNQGDVGAFKPPSQRQGQGREEAAGDVGAFKPGQAKDKGKADRTLRDHELGDD